MEQGINNLIYYIFINKENMYLFKKYCLHILGLKVVQNYTA